MVSGQRQVGEFHHEPLPRCISDCTSCGLERILSSKRSNQLLSSYTLYEVFLQSLPNQATPRSRSSLLWVQGALLSTLFRDKHYPSSDYPQPLGRYAGSLCTAAVVLTKRSSRATTVQPKTLYQSKAHSKRRPTSALSIKTTYGKSLGRSDNSPKLSHSFVETRRIGRHVLQCQGLHRIVHPHLTSAMSRDHPPPTAPAPFTTRSGVSAARHTSPHLDS